MSTESNSGGPPPSQGPDPIIGKEIDGCTIVKKIGQGGMGIVFLAEHSKLRQQYVVKILNPALTAAEDTVQRFFREAQSVARLNHPSIVGIQNVGQEGEYYYIRMEFVDGDTVENIVKEKKKLEWKLATSIILETAEALSHAHKKGTIHRDIKPENIMLTKAGEVKVMDFGLAKQVQAATKVSVTGQIVGTPFFMSPEQAGGKTVDARSDIYSLGVSYYYLLTGVKPFNGKNLQEIFLKHFFYTPESPKIYAPELPENVCEIIRRCLKKKKKERYQSAAQLAKDLRAIMEGGELSAPETSDSADTGGTGTASASDLNLKRGPGGSNLDAGKTSRSFAASSSDPSLAVMGGDTVSRDLAAAQAEIGAGEPGTMVSQGTASPENGSATVIARAVAASDAPPSADAPSAPMTKRGGRVSLTTQSAGASLVFQPGAAPFQQGGTATAPPPSSDPDVGAKAPVLPDPRIGPDGTSTVKLDPTKKPPVAPPKGEKRKPAVRPIKALVVGGAVVVLLGVYQVLGYVKFNGLEERYSKAQSVHPPENDAAGWTDLKKDWDDLADNYDKFGTTFKLTPSGVEALARAEKCRESARTAEASRVTAEKAALEERDREKRRVEILANKEKARKDLTAKLDQVKALVTQKKYDEAAKVAADAHFIATELNERLADVKCPVEVSCELAAKIFAGASNEELGTLNPGQAVVVLVPLKDKNFKLEVRKPKFKPYRYPNEVAGFTRIRAILEREIKSRFSLGKTDEMALFKIAKVTQPLFVTAPMAIDTQDPQSLDVICQDGSLRSYEIRNGRPRWNKQQAIGQFGDRMPAPDVLAGRAIVTATPDGTVSAHDVPTGAVVASRKLGAPLVAAPRIDASARYIVAGTITGDIVCLDLNVAQNGVASEKWRVSTDASILTQPLIQGNNAIVGSLDDRLRVIDIPTGKVIAYYDAREAICAGPIAPGAVIYLGTREGRVHAISIEGSAITPVFQTAPAGSEIRQIMGAGKGVYYSTVNDVRSTDGQGNRVFEPFTPKVDGIPLEVAGFVPMNDSIAIATTNGWVFSIDGKTGAENWKLDLRAQVRVPPVFDGELHVATVEGEIITIGGD